MPTRVSDISSTLLLRPVQTAFFEALANPLKPAQWSRVSTVVPSTTAVETYGWLGQTPKMREWRGERYLKDMKAFAAYTVTNRLWESTIAIERSAVEDDNHGQIMLRVQELADEYNRFLDELVFGMLVNSNATSFSIGDDTFSTLAFDGYALAHASSHDLGGGAIVNKGTAALTSLNVATVMGVMNVYKGDLGKYLQVDPDVLVVPPKLKINALSIANSAINVVDAVTTGAANIYIQPTAYESQLKGMLDVITTPYFAADAAGNTQNWALIDSRLRLRPIIVQQRTPVEFTELQNESEPGFMRDCYCYGVRARFAVAPGWYPGVYTNVVA